MKRIKNTLRRRLGIPGRTAIILDPGQSVAVAESQLEEMAQNRTVVQWLDRGVLKVLDYDEAEPAVEVKLPRKPDPNPAPDLPEGLTGQGFELHHVGGGWYRAYMNGFEVSDRNMRKDEAEGLAKDYE